MTDAKRTISLADIRAAGPVEVVPGRRLKGAKEIARFMGVSVDTVERLAKKPGSPITKPMGRYLAWERDLERFLAGEY